MRVCVVHASQQNIFFTEMLDAFAGALADNGIAVEKSVDCFPQPHEDLVSLFVPHEFHPLVESDSLPSYRQLLRSVALCTEQPGTTWFTQAARIAADAGAAIDINELGVAALREEGIDARLVRLGYVPGWDHWHGDTGRQRDIDVTFMGGDTERRKQIIASCGQVLQNRRASLHLFETVLPHKADDPYFLSGERKWDLLARSRVIVNVHRSELGYLEWQRVVGAMANGCVVLTEHSLGIDPLVPGRHFVSARAEDIPEMLDALLGDPDWQNEIRQNAYRLLRDEFSMADAAGSLIEALRDVASIPLPGPDPGEPASLPRPRTLYKPSPPYDEDRRGDNAAIRGGLKQLSNEVRQLQRRLDAGGQNQPDTVASFGPDRDPRVSVVITLHNYAEYVGPAIASVARSEMRDLELIVLDDASTDDSASAAATALEAAPWLTATLVRQNTNRGLPASRNHGIELARGQYVFMLDADNAIYPHALGRLVEALDQDSEAAFAYGLIETFDEHGPRGLMSYLGWDTQRLSWGNYIDAMAMIRREILLQLGGYAEDAALYGWEDYALWCEMATHGFRGLRVPEILTRYRVGRHSMISQANVDTGGLWSTFLRRYPWLAVNGGQTSVLPGAVPTNA